MQRGGEIRAPTPDSRRSLTSVLCSSMPSSSADKISMSKDGDISRVLEGTRQQPEDIHKRRVKFSMSLFPNYQSRLAGYVLYVYSKYFGHLNSMIPFG